MKILHTADWHLGQKFKQNLDRIDEHRHAMAWLLELIKEEEIEVLVVAGDIFDTPNPPNNARALYYKFLVDVVKVGCKHVVITGGNHDSPNMLNAPKEILSAIQTHVVGCATGNIEDEIIPLYSDKGALEAVVAAVPFLRDRDLKTAISGESGEERIEKIKQGIKAHYQEAAEAVEEFEADGVPIITTGHLYAKGASASDKQDNIYIGDMENIAADHFPEVFDYVALGHIHSAQIIGKKNHIRYSGSLIPMSFGEWKDQKSVTIIEFKGREIKDVRLVKAPLFRKLVSIKGTDTEVDEELQGIIKDIENSSTPLEAWIEILITSEETRPDVYHYYNELVKSLPIRILRVSYARTYKAADALSTEYELDHLQPLDIFKKRCEAAGLEEKETKISVKTFKELMNWMAEKEVS